MNEKFAELFAESIAANKLQPGSVVTAKVIEITSDYIIVDAGLKTEAYIPIAEFKDLANELEVAVGDEVEVMVDAVEDGTGETILSREKAKRLRSWEVLEKAFAENKAVRGIISERVKGGFTVDLNKVYAFLPGSLVDVRPVRDTSYLEGKELDFKLIKLDKKRNNIVVSRRAIIAEESGADKEALLANLQEGQEVIGMVKNLTDYGAFIDLGGVDGLLHITDISWKRIKHPNEVLTIGDEIKVKVLKFDKEKNRVSLGLKQLSEDPWVGIERRYPVGTRLFGKITNITDYGCFVEVESGIEGLVHMSEMDWTNKNIHPAKLVSLGDEVEVMVLEVDEAKRRVSLGMKQCQSNPWEIFATSHNKGEKISGKIRSITDFGIFVGLEGNIDGLIHLSDISWTEPGEKAIRKYKKGQDLETVILGIDAERERISLGIKQLEEDYGSTYFADHPKGSVVSGKVIEITPKVVTVNLAENVDGKLRVNEISKTKISDATQVFDVGDEIKAKVINYDKKSRILHLSTKEFQSLDNSDAPAMAKLGDLLKEKIERKE